MKKIPLTIIPLAVLGIVAYLFAFVIPSGGDLISESGDTLLGIIVGILLVLCIFADIKRYRKN
jgi:hypothetical protein